VNHTVQKYTQKTLQLTYPNFNTLFRLWASSHHKTSVLSTLIRIACLEIYSRFQCGSYCQVPACSSWFWSRRHADSSPHVSPQRTLDKPTQSQRFRSKTYALRFKSTREFNRGTKKKVHRLKKANTLIEKKLMVSEKQVVYLNCVVCRARVGILGAVTHRKISTHVYGSWSVRTQSSATINLQRHKMHNCSEITHDTVQYLYCTISFTIHLYFTYPSSMELGFMTDDKTYWNRELRSSGPLRSMLW